MELVQIDVCDEDSIAAAAKTIKSKGVSLYGLVNNAGVGLQTSKSPDDILVTNYYGPKKVTEAFLDLMDAKEGRVVNVSSGAASMWLRNQDDKTKKLFSSYDTTVEELEAAIKENLSSKNFSMGSKGQPLAYIRHSLVHVKLLYHRLSFQYS